MTSRVQILSDVAGKVWKIEAKPGDALAIEDTIMILESMKMEIPVETDKAGKLIELLVAEGDPVAEEQAVAIIEV